MKTLLSILIFWFTSTGYEYPTSGASTDSAGAASWTNPGNIVSDNGSNASATAASDYLVASSFGFSLPEGAQVDGITVLVQGSEHSGGTETVSAQLQDASGSLFGTEKTAVFNGTAMTNYSYGNAGDLWGATLNKTIVEDIDFGVRVWYTTSHTINIDYIAMALEYSMPSGRRVIITHKR